MEILRGAVPLPPDLEERFRQTFGRELDPEERRFLGMEVRGETDAKPVNAEPKLKAA